MAILNDLIVRGATRCLNTLYANSLQVDSQTISGNLTVNGYTYMGYSTSRSDTKLSVAGITNNQWYRSTGNVGWYNDSHGGGIYMTDSTYVKTYNNKAFYAYNGLYTGSTQQYYLNVDGKLNVADGVFSNNLNVGISLVSRNISATNLLRAAKYDLQTITQVGSNGTLYVAPSIQFPTSNTTSVAAASTSITIIDTNITSDVMAGVVWRPSAKVKISGTINGVVTGTVDGTITSINTSSKTMVIGNLSGGNWSSVVAGTYTKDKIENLNIMMYETYQNSTYYPVGILLTSYGSVSEHTDGTAKTFIDIYGGSATKPAVRLGNMTGLDAINGVTPSGWGLYTSNGYFSGLIVSTSGKIGGWSLSTNSLTTGTWGSSGSAMLCTGSTTQKAIGGSPANTSGWVFTAGENFGVTSSGALYANSAHISGEITATSGTIGGFQVGNTAIHTKNVEITSNADNSIALSSADFTRTINNISRGGLRFAIGNKLGITGDGIVYASGVDLTGKITATEGYIGNSTNGFTIDSSGFYSGTKTANTSGYIALSNSNFTRTINSTSVSTLRFAIGSKFGVTTDGTLYANGANIKNISASNISSGSLSADRISAGSLAIGKLTLDAQETISDAAKTATNYFYYNTTVGLIMSSSASTQTYAGASTGYNARLTSTALEIRNGTNVLASYGSTVVLGKSGSSQQIIDGTSMKFNDSTGTTQFIIDNNTIGYIRDKKEVTLLLSPADERGKSSITRADLTSALYNHFRGYTCASNSEDYCTTTTNAKVIVKLYGGYVYSEEYGPDYSQVINFYTFDLSGMSFSLSNNAINGTKTTSGDSASSYSTIADNYIQALLDGLNAKYQADEASYEATEKDTSPLAVWIEVYFQYPATNTSMTLGTRGLGGKGCGSLSIGRDNIVYGNYSVGMGKGLNVTSDFTTIVGSYNRTILNTLGEEEDVAFAVGSGTDVGEARATPFAVLKNGTIIMSGNNTQAGQQVTVAPNKKETIVTPFPNRMPSPPFVFLTLESKGRLNNVDNIKDMGKIQIYLHEVTEHNFTVYIINNGAKSHVINWKWFAICTN